MRRWRLRLAVLGAGAALSAASAPTLSAWVTTTSTPPGTLSAIPDWVAPTIDRVVVQKTQGGKPNHVKPTGTYHVCSQIGADTGNPASGLKSVLVSATSLTTNIVSGVLGVLGTGSPCAATDNRDSGSLTVAAGTTVGTKSVSLTVSDNAAPTNNTRTESASVTVDSNPPDPVSFETVNKTNGTEGKPEPGDTVVFTFDEPIDPHAIFPGWNGSGSQTVFGYFVQQGNNDRFQIFRQVNATYPQVPLTNTTAGSTNYVALGRNYVGASVAFTGSTMTVSGDEVRIVLGTPDPAVTINTDLGTTATAWYTNTTLFDYAGNFLSATPNPLTESGGLDTEF